MFAVRLCLVLMVSALTACAANAPVSAEGEHAIGRFEPAPMPSVRPRGTAAPEYPILTKMPPGTGAVPVSGSAVRGSVLTGLKESF